MRRHAALTPTLALLALLCTPAGAGAAPKATLSASFYPELLGHSTTLSYALTTSEPVPVESIDIRLPRGLALTGSQLGLAECQPHKMQEDGPHACPANSIMGYGTATGGVLIGAPHPFLVRTHAHVTLALGPIDPGQRNPTILILAEPDDPIDPILLTSQLIPASGRYSYQLQIHVPVLSTWPEGPDIALTHLHATIGPRHVFYEETEDGVIFDYHPRGLTLPSRCPPRGFPFLARVHFYDGATAIAHTRAPCPRARRRRRRARHG